MNGFAALFLVSCRLHFRNRMALLYGYLFPLIFLVAFWVLYRHESVPLLRHMGELLTVSILGGACFGLPTSMVSERERGVWRRYRLTPATTWSLVASTVAARYVIILSSGLLQLAVALAVGMTFPEEPLLLFATFSVVAFAFIGLGLVIAMLADTVPAVQALGQCVFLPMLIIGGVAVNLSALPEWAQILSGFFPGRYAVEALQATVSGKGLEGLSFCLMSLTLSGIAGSVAGAKLFRWDAQQKFATRGGKVWLTAVFAAWLAVGGISVWRDQMVAEAKTLASRAAAEAEAAAPRHEWEKITAKDVAALDYHLPPDEGVVAPFAPSDMAPDDYVVEQLTKVRENISTWAPGLAGDDVQRVRTLICVAAVPDSVQQPCEMFIPAIVLDHLQATFPKVKLIQMLTWIAKNPDAGTVVDDVTDIGVGGTADPELVRERAYFYAIKFVARLTGRRDN